MITSVTYLDSPLGWMRLEGIAQVLCKINFLDEKLNDEHAPELLEHSLIELKQFFDGDRKHFTMPTYMAGTHFQKNVWEELVKIPFGKTFSYEDIARKLGDIKVIRAAATANGRNPLCIVVPCHRVIGKDGSLTGYSGGLWRKKWLLDFEQRNAQPKLL
jgi:methylated-DNA-[protein]-cysteine S-methyltransferase